MKPRSLKSHGSLGAIIWGTSVLINATDKGVMQDRGLHFYVTVVKGCRGLSLTVRRETYNYKVNTEWF